MLDNPEGTNTERYVFGKLSARWFQRRPLWHPQYTNCGDIEHRQSAQRGVIYTVVHGTRLCTLPITPFAYWKPCWAEGEAFIAGWGPCSFKPSFQSLAFINRVLSPLPPSFLPSFASRCQKRERAAGSWTHLVLLLLILIGVLPGGTRMPTR